MKNHSDQKRPLGSRDAPELRLQELLKRLPRQAASDQFTDRVLERLPEGGSRRGGLAIYAAALVLISVGGWLLSSQLTGGSPRSLVADLPLEPQEAELEELRSTYRSLQLELEELRKLRAAASTIIEFGGDDRFDYSLDLRDIYGPSEDRLDRAPSARPAVYRSRWE